MTPDWLQPVVDGVRNVEASQLTRFVPPAGFQGREGAVLFLFGEAAQGPDVLLTERAHHMRSHPGQVSFPGGSVDPGDDGPEAAALREAEEETGLDPSGVEIFGTMPRLWLPPSNFAVTPVMGWWARESEVRVVDPSEVESVHRVPISELLDPAHRITVTHPSGYHSPGFLIGDSKDLILWGFTAGVISRLFDFIGWTRPWDESKTRELPGHMLGSGRERRTLNEDLDEDIR